MNAQRKSWVQMREDLMNAEGKVMGIRASMENIDSRLKELEWKLVEATEELEQLRAQPIETKATKWFQRKVSNILERIELVYAEQKEKNTWRQNWENALKPAMAHYEAAKLAVETEQKRRDLESAREDAELAFLQGGYAHPRRYRR
jgi:chromosome segregation ATPase